jgi:CRP-like cAMP-binding protein
MSNLKVYKKGEILIKEGEKAQTVLFIQTGSVALQVQRHKVTIELCTLGSSQIVGEHALSGATTHPHTAVALMETKVVELPVEGVRTQIEAAPQLM